MIIFVWLTLCPAALRNKLKTFKDLQIQSEKIVTKLLITHSIFVALAWSVSINSTE